MNTKDPDIVIRAMARMYMKLDGQHQALTGQLRTIAKQEKEIAALKERLALQPDEVSTDLEIVRLRQQVETQRETIQHLQHRDSQWIDKTEELGRLRRKLDRIGALPYPGDPADLSDTIQSILQEDES